MKTTLSTSDGNTTKTLQMENQALQSANNSAKRKRILRCSAVEEIRSVLVRRFVAQSLSTRNPLSCRSAAIPGNECPPYRNIYATKLHARLLIDLGILNNNLQ